MSEQSPNASLAPNPRRLIKELAPYREPSSARSLFELAITALPFLLTWFLIWVAVDSGYWIGLLLAVPAAGFLVRLFLIQHDCVVQGFQQCLAYFELGVLVGGHVDLLQLTSRRQCCIATRRWYYPLR